jgi:hypothetical protein
MLLAVRAGHADEVDAGAGGNPAAGTKARMHFKHILRRGRHTEGCGAERPRVGDDAHNVVTLSNEDHVEGQRSVLHPELLRGFIWKDEQHTRIRCQITAVHEPARARLRRRDDLDRHTHRTGCRIDDDFGAPGAACQASARQYQ